MGLQGKFRYFYPHQPEKSFRMETDNYECMLCEYTYRPERGDPSQGIPPGTPFDDLPEDWQCPKCGASREKFYPAD